MISRDGGADDQRPRRHRSLANRCADCLMHRTLCICALVPRIVTRSRLVLLMHQLEQRKTTNTGRLAARCLASSAIGSLGAGPPAASSERPPWQISGTQPVLLFPDPDARPLEDWRGSPIPLTLVVPDGTWRQANKARRRVAGLADLPCAALPLLGAPSGYRLRHDARPNRLATIEAIAIALEILEGPEEGPRVRAALDRIFRVMVDRTLWTNGRIATEAVTGGIPAGVRPHNPLGLPLGLRSAAVDEVAQRLEPDQLVPEAREAGVEAARVRDDEDARAGDGLGLRAGAAARR
jgi:DTW domain-containing protein YfiP